MAAKNPYEDYILNCNASRDREKNWGITSAVAAEHLTSDAIENPPPACDLRRKWWPIEDQGSTGSCVGWAVADTMYWLFTEQEWHAEEEKLSARYLWMAAKETDEFTDRPSSFIERQGTSLKAALAVVYKYGIVLNADLPFASATLYSADEASFYAKAAKNRITSYFDLGNDLSVWRSWLAVMGPIVVRLEVDKAWMDLAIRPDKDKGLLDTYSGKRKSFGGHACILAGFTKNHRFIVRNSWGTAWGKDGYAFASEKYAKNAFTEAYGIVL